MKNSGLLSILVKVVLLFSFVIGFGFGSDFPVRNVDHTDPWIFSKPTLQTQLSAKNTEMLVLQFPGDNTISKIGLILDWVRTNFNRYRGRGEMAAKQSAQEIFTRRKLSGCNDWGLILTSLLRNLGYPVVFMNAAGIEWAKRHKEDSSIEFMGHTFLEVYVEGKWIVMDSVTGEYIEDYDFKDPVIPIPKKRAGEKGYFVYQKGLDHWSMGVHSIKDNEKIMREFALMYPLEEIIIKEKTISRLIPKS
ncbi:MAG: transglutaminase domain-containing protein [Candidatus Aminicenantes bacterium]|nr:transglutaminase domain-containing protein [Candidatus Aminicenantes bacterium]